MYFLYNFGCSACGMKGHMNPNLSLTFEVKDPGVRNLKQWHRIQKRYGRSFVPEAGKEIFRDEKVDIYENPKGGKRLLGKGTVSLWDDRLILAPDGADPVKLPVSDIRIVSPVGLKKLVVSGRDFSYFVQGEPGFNGYKYAQIYYSLSGQPDREVK